MTAARAILPDRPMSAAEQRGFRIALGCVETWGRRLLAEPAVYGHREAVAEVRAGGAMLLATARALDRTLGRAPTAEPISHSGAGRSSPP